MSLTLLGETLDPVNILLAVAFGVVMFAFLLFKRDTNQKALDDYLVEHRIKAKVEKTYFIPFRFWLKNKKGDLWRKLVYSNGDIKFARVRLRLTGISVDIFDHRSGASAPTSARVLNCWGKGDKRAAVRVQDSIPTP